MSTSFSVQALGVSVQEDQHPVSREEDSTNTGDQLEVELLAVRLVLGAVASELGGNFGRHFV